jgi:hypothetical protein
MDFSLGWVKYLPLPTECLVSWLVLLLFIWEAMGLNLSPETALVFVGYLREIQG